MAKPGPNLAEFAQAQPPDESGYIMKLRTVPSPRPSPPPLSPHQPPPFLHGPPQDQTSPGRRTSPNPAPLAAASLSEPPHHGNCIQCASKIVARMSAGCAWCSVLSSVQFLLRSVSADRPHPLSSPPTPLPLLLIDHTSPPTHPPQGCLGLSYIVLGHFLKSCSWFLRRLEEYDLYFDHRAQKGPASDQNKVNVGCEDSQPLLRYLSRLFDP